MIQPRTMLNVADNTGARLLQVFKILGGSRKRYAQIGDVVVCSVKLAEPRKMIKKKEIVRALIVRQKNNFRRKDGSYIKFDENAAIIVEKEKKEMRGARVSGPIPREIGEAGYGKIISLAAEVV